MKFKSNIETQAGIEDSAASAGTAGQLLSSLGPVAGVDGVEWVDQSTIVAAAATLVEIECKNTSGSTITKGTPVYQTGNVGATAVIEIAEADALISANKGPAIGLLQDTLTNNAFGFVVIIGELLNFTTSPIDGVTPTVGDKIFVKSGGGLTTVKPTTSLNSIQAIGLIGKVSGGNAGSVTVSSTMRANDVPNLPEGRIWIGDGNTIVSDTVYVDEPNSRVGINTATPIYDLDVDGTVRASGGFIDNTFTSDDTVRIVSPDNATYTVASGGETGAIKIQAPNAVLGGVTGTDTKVSFKVNISDGVVIQISGNFSRPGVGVAFIWTALSVTTISNASTDNNYTITTDGSGSGAIWIGSSTDSQAGLKGIWVTDCQVSGGIGGLSGGSPQSSAWDISINASVPTGIGAGLVVNNTQVTNWKRNGQDVYYGSGSGNVGIGVTSPGAKLDVYGGLKLGTTGTLSISQSPFSTTTFYATAGNGSTITFGVPAPNTQNVSVQGDLYSYQGSIGTKLNSASFNNKITYNGDNYLNSGNLGIGTTNPGAKLDVVGTGSFSDSVLFNKAVPTGAITPTRYRSHTGYSLTSDSNYQKMVCYGYNGNSANPIFQVATKGFAADVTAAWDNDASTRFTVLAGGNVGIGTTSPNAKLEVAGSTRITGSGLDVGYGNNDTNFIQVGNGRTTNGYAFIDLIGDSTYSDYGLRIIRNNTGPNTSTSLIHRGTGFFDFTATQAANITFKTNNTERIRINSSGNVGIGTTNPGAKLDVAGNIIVSGGVSNENDGVRVTNPGGASFITQSSSIAGAIKITLPQGGINTMMRMEVKVYEYLTNESFTVQCGGYSAGTSQWYNEYAYIESSAKDDRNFTVRFGYDGSKSCIYIGELSSTWSYPQVFVTEFQGGYLNTTGYKDGWDISFEASAFQGVVKTQTGTQINNWARSGTNTYYASSTGNVGIGTTNPTQAKLQITVPDYNTGCRMNGPSGGTTFTWMSFYAGASYRGAISPTSTGVNYASASDYRLKENVIKLQNSTERIKKLKPSNFNFLENPSETVDGFIAHEVQEIVPEAVTGEKDAVELDGKPNYQGVDQSKIVPLLTAALQEAISKIEQLETRIQKLENK